MNKTKNQKIIKKFESNGFETLINESDELYFAKGYENAHINEDYKIRCEKMDENEIESEIEAKDGMIELLK